MDRPVRLLRLEKLSRAKSLKIGKLSDLSSRYEYVRERAGWRTRAD